ncbi:DUF975 family protein [Clostridium sp. 'deep sea']|uniref:DUF975 family protein n=1 Tax=Clostridium sp. 'deep sea' TaxID=2779445 RepID=UPI0018964A58|nr:DUF975 family protein [Clostridium sp. 'deep sea']QOR36714.1 DUF975 family protein [Clostridium sp. 'deep sea']
MWSISNVKEQAKRVLNGTYWSAFLVCLLVAIVNGNYSNTFRYTYEHKDYYLTNSNYIKIAVGLLVIMVIRILIGYILDVGSRRYLLDLCKGHNNIGTIGYGFCKSRYTNIVKTMLYKNILLFLWSLLLIIPGIIMSYAYRFVPYLLADNPNMKPSRALELSMDMTDGHKWNLFVFDLTFLGWYILGSIAFGIGIFFVFPYQETALTEVYNQLKLTAITDKLTCYKELSEPEEVV